MGKRKTDKPSILVTFDSMRYPNTGLYYFGQSLGKALAAQNKARFNLSYYINDKSNKQFNNDDLDLVVKKVHHKLFFPDQKKFDVFHFTDQYCRLDPSLVKGKKILTIHDLNPLQHSNSTDKQLKAYLENTDRLINTCDKIVTISNFVAADITRHFPDASAKLSVIYNGADKLLLKEGHTPGYLPEKSFLFTIGMLTEKKNFHVLPALLAGNDLELVISGIDTPYRNKIMKEAEKIGAANRVIITGAITDADRAWYYQNCEAFVFPSLAEGFGLPVVEAMHFGKPVFLSKHTSLPEIGQDKAFYFDSFNADDMQTTFINGLHQFKAGNMAGDRKRARPNVYVGRRCRTISAPLHRMPGIVK